MHCLMACNVFGLFNSVVFRRLFRFCTALRMAVFLELNYPVAETWAALWSCTASRSACVLPGLQIFHDSPPESHGILVAWFCAALRSTAFY